MKAGIALLSFSFAFRNRLKLTINFKNFSLFWTIYLQQKFESSSLNLFALIPLLKNVKKQASYYYIINLTLSNLAFCSFVNLHDAIWNVTVQWWIYYYILYKKIIRKKLRYGGNFLCKALQASVSKKKFYLMCQKWRNGCLRIFYFQHSICYPQYTTNIFVSHLSYWNNFHCPGTHSQCL